MAVWDQAGALLGVIVGAGGSYIAAGLNERSRWRRAREERWDEKKFHTYTTYAHTLKAQLRVAERIGAARAWHEAVWNVELYARGLKVEPAGWASAVRRTGLARDAFYACARHDLAIEGPPPPSGNWPRVWQQDDPH
ncbi:hypothetical protein [Streptomyces sp. NPDC050738]|uniref:hypothetical protein n=1 Tax=Streptomyces sp. NPDC050738 TaxID=3154744 RepID=UPI003416B92D